MKFINHLFLFLIIFSLINCVKEKEKPEQNEKENSEEGNIMLLMEGAKLEVSLQGKKNRKQKLLHNPNKSWHSRKNIQRSN